MLDRTVDISGVHHEIVHGWLAVVVTALVTSTKLSYTSNRLVLGLVTTSGGSSIPVFSSNSASLSLAICVGRCSEYWRWFRLPLGRNGEFCVAVGTVTRTAGILDYCMLA